MPLSCKLLFKFFAAFSWHAPSLQQLPRLSILAPVSLPLSGTAPLPEPLPIQPILSAMIILPFCLGASLESSMGEACHTEPSVVDVGQQFCTCHTPVGYIWLQEALRVAYMVI
uniref:Uncharacterized protein n=1 Tax=Dunaliella tertiolecta TaxID=3047 RepID=A0A7S3VRV7_DUNTE